MGRQGPSAGGLAARLCPCSGLRSLSSGWSRCSPGPRSSQLDVESALALALLALGSTLPLAVLGAASAALLACAASVLSLADFHLLSVASAAAVLIALFRLGRGPHGLFQFLAIGLAAPFLVLALTGPNPSSSESATLTVVLAALAPVAAIGGIAVQARREAQENRAARQVIADTLIEHTARGERARIARELHDVVAHHISMVAVQAEAARLAVPGLPAAGAQRLSAIGDTAREALVEMRRLLGVLREDAGIEVVDRHPQPGLDQVIELVDEAREAIRLSHAADLSRRAHRPRPQRRARRLPHRPRGAHQLETARPRRRRRRGACLRRRVAAAPCS